MNSQNIYEVLCSIPHKKIYIDKYTRFIKSRKQFCEGIYEIHHICPKSLFPNFQDLKEFPWNSVILTPREHFLAHWFLFKAYGGKMINAIHAMLNLDPNSSEYFRYKPKSSVIYDAARTAFILRVQDTAPAKDPITNESLGRIDINDSRWKTGEIVSTSVKTASAKCALTHVSLGRIDINDSRWKTGEIVGITKGTSPAICAITQESLGRISILDPRWDTGEIIYCHAGKKTNRINAKIKETGEPIGNIDISDPRWNSGEIEPLSKYTITAKDPITNKIYGRVKLSDKRLKSRELVASSAKIIPCVDPYSLEFVGYFRCGDENLKSLYVSPQHKDK